MRQRTMWINRSEARSVLVDPQNRTDSIHVCGTEPPSVRPQTFRVEFQCSFQSHFRDGISYDLQSWI